MVFSVCSISILATVGVAGGAVSASAATTGSEECAPVAVLAFRGSGNDNLDPSVTSFAGAPYAYGDTDLVTNGWESEMLSRLFSAMSVTTTAAGFEGDSIPVIGVGADDGTVGYGYEAAGVWTELTGGVLDSAEEGAAAAQYIMQEFKAAQPEGCGSTTKFILAGYSQGAMAARLAAQQNPNDIAGVFDYGDPMQLANAQGNIGTAADGNGAIRWAYPEQQAAWDAFYGIEASKSATCTIGDPVCEFTWSSVWSLLAGTGTHGSYLQGDVAVSEATRLVALAEAVTDAAATTTESTALEATISVASTAIVGNSTTLSAVGSATSGAELEYAFDTDGDGVVDVENSTGVAEVIYTKPGDVDASVQVTDANGNVSSDSTLVSVYPLEEAVTAVDFETPSLVVDVASRTVDAGATIDVQLTGDNSASQYSALFVPATDAPLTIEPAAAIDVLPADWQTAGIEVPAELPSGAYELVVGDDELQWGTISLQVQ